MAKRLIRLTEGDLHKIIKESVKRILREDIDATEYIDNNVDKYLSDKPIQHGYGDELEAAQSMPDDYDDDLGFDNFEDVERVAHLNRPYDTDIYPFAKDIENNASWDAIDDEYAPPYDDGSAENINTYDTWK